MKTKQGNSEIIIVHISSCEEEKINLMCQKLLNELAKETGSKSIAPTKYNSVNEENYIQVKFKKYETSCTKIIVELCTNKSPEHIVEISESGYTSTKKKSFFSKLAQFTFEFEYKEDSKGKIKLTQITSDTSTLNKIAEKKKIPILLLNVCENELIFNYNKIYETIKKILVFLENLDWEMNNCGMYRVWQAKKQIPQDHIEFICDNLFKENSFLHLCSFDGAQVTARVKGTKQIQNEELNKFLSEHGVGSREEYVVLTNRLIEILFGRDWIIGEEKSPGLAGIPIVVYENICEEYEIGIPKANQVNNVSLSSKLFSEKHELSSKFAFYIFNKYTDSRMYIDVNRKEYNYCDFGRVKKPKIMMPRYYRLMMGYLDKPYKTIRKEEYDKIYIDCTFNIEIDGKSETKSIEKGDFDRCYAAIPGQSYYRLIEESDLCGTELEKNQYIRSKKLIVDYLEYLHAYDYAVLIRVPIPKHLKGNNVFFSVLKGLYSFVLSKAIGKAEYTLKTNWADDVDDKNNVARLNHNMMNLIGVSENDKIVVYFGKNNATLRVLEKNDLHDYEICIPAPSRRILEMNSANDLVIVHRDMTHTFLRNSQVHTIAILGTVLAVAQVLTAYEIFKRGILIVSAICIFAIVFMLYFALNEERIKVK